MVQYELYNADGDDIREKLDRGNIDLGILVEPVETAKYDFFRLPYEDLWGVLLRKDDPLADRQTVEVADLKDLPILLPRRSLVQDTLESWLGIDQQGLRVLGTQNLISNAYLLVKAGLGRAVTLQGACSIRNDDSTRFIPLSPVHTSGHVLAWRKNHVLPTAAAQFIAYLKDTFQA